MQRSGASSRSSNSSSSTSINGLGQNPHQHPQHTRDESARKCSATSVAARHKGQELLARNSRSHSPELHRAALALFSKSVAFAPSRSEELALGHASRSELLQHLRKLEPSIGEVEAALRLTGNAALKRALLERKEDCARAIAELEERAKALGREDRLRVLAGAEDDPEVQGELELCAELAELEAARGPLPMPKPAPANGEERRADELDCCSPGAVELRITRRLGRHWVARRALATGELLALEDVYAGAVYEEQRYIVCGNCLAYTWTGLPCERCAGAVYCSERCRRAAWERYHELECIAVPELIAASPAKTVESSVGRALVGLAIQTLLRAVIDLGLERMLEEARIAEESPDKRKRGFSNDGSFRSETFRSVCSLMHDCDAESLKHTRRQYHTLNTGIWNILKERFAAELEGKTLEDKVQLANSTRDLLIRLISIVSFNFFQCEGTECTCEHKGQHKWNCIIKKGVFLASCASLINHSCCPNIYSVFHDGKLMTVATRPIKPNEQLCRSYSVNISVSKLVRQTHLKRTYLFDCECEACNENWPVLTINHIVKARCSFERWLIVRAKKDLVKPNITERLLSRYLIWLCQGANSQDYLPDLCRTIDEIYRQKQTLFAAEVETISHKNFVYKWLYALYVTKFNMPDEC